MGSTPIVPFENTNGVPPPYTNWNSSLQTLFQKVCPNASLVATGGILSTDENFLANFDREERNLENDVKRFNYFPVITPGLTYS